MENETQRSDSSCFLFNLLFAFFSLFPLALALPLRPSPGRVNEPDAAAIIATECVD